MNDELGDVRAQLEELKQLVLKLTGPKERQRCFKFHEAAALLGVHPKTVSRMVAEGELLVTELRGARLIHIDEIDRVSKPRPTPERPRLEKSPAYDAAAASRKLRDLRGR